MSMGFDTRDPKIAALPFCPPPLPPSVDQHATKIHLRLICEATNMGWQGRPCLHSTSQKRVSLRATGSAAQGRRCPQQAGWFSVCTHLWFPLPPYCINSFYPALNVSEWWRMMMSSWRWSIMIDQSHWKYTFIWCDKVFYYSRPWSLGDTVDDDPE